MSLRSDEAIIQIVLEGDKQAFGELIQRYWGMIFGLAYQRLGETMLAEDRAQETFLQAFLKLETLQSPKRFRAWLYGICLNLCKNYFRQQKHSGYLFDFEDDWQENLAVSESDTEAIELQSEIQQALELLSEANRQTVLLYYYQGFKLDEIATMLDISPTAVKGRLHKSRQSLKAQLNHLFISHPKRINQGAKQMIPVKIVDTPQQMKLNRHGSYYSLSQILLYNDETRRALLIWIDEGQAINIALALSGKDFPRPRPHDFTVKLLESSRATLEHVLIQRLSDRTLFATIQLKLADSLTSIDASASEGISLAARSNAPIFVSPELWEKASPPLPEGKTPNRKGIEMILSRLEEVRDAQSHWIEQKRLEHADKGVNPDNNMRDQARLIINEAFS